MLKNLRLKVTSLSIICLSSASFLVQAKPIENLEFSGFARAVVGYINDDEVDFNGYDDSFNFDSETLLGLRADYQINQKLNIVTQGVAYANPDRKSKIQWLYLDYRPSNNLSFKIGRQRAPLFDFSEVIDVGFAYPWISLPQSVYIPFLFTEFDGILGTYEFSKKHFSGSFDAYYGAFNSDIDLTGNDVNADVKDFFGIIGTVDISQFSFRASVHHAKAQVMIDELIPFQNTLNQLGFVESANSLEINDSAEYQQFSIKWENIDYFARAEYSSFDSDAFLIPNTEGYYVSVGYNFYPFTVHTTFSSSSVKTSSNFPNEIPIGVNQQLDILAFQYQAASTATAVPEIESVSVGIRYDLQSNIALKGDLTFLKEGQGVASNNQRPSPFVVANDSQLLQFAVEWIF